jgi:protein arginine kinase activator
MSLKTCQKCSKPATLHITEIIKGVPHELHLCEDHAQQFLNQPQPTDEALTDVASTMAQHFTTGVTEQKLAQLDKQECPVCGITFLEFRSQGRLGCPNDYEAFKDELVPLLENIHGQSQHCGKVPQRAPGDSKRQTQLIKLRNDLKRAVAEEEYEAAARLRDEIADLEGNVT